MLPKLRTRVRFPSSAPKARHGLGHAAAGSENPSATWLSTLTSRCEICADYGASSRIVENRCDAQGLCHSSPHHE